MKISVDPNTEAGGFGYVEAGTYALRVVSVDLKEGKKAPYLKWEFELVDANTPTVSGKGKAGHVFENTTLKSGENSQFRLRQLCDSLGREWGDFDTEEVVGMELQAALRIKEFEGTFSNEVSKFLPR